MRALLLLILVVLVLSLIGWISFSKGPDRASINVETDQIRSDTDRAVESGAKLLHKAGEELEQKTGRQIEQAPPATPQTAPVSR